MTILLRAAGDDDLAALYEMAKSTGGGFTNLPPDQDTLAGKLAIAGAAFTREEDTLADDKFIFILEDRATGKALGTCQIFSKIGSTWPFYTYRIDSFTHYNQELERTIRSEMLTLCTDHNGCTEVGGLFLSPTERSAGTGALLARSRYLFIAMHRQRFAHRTIAELRGVHDESGGSPFWDSIGGRFFGMSLLEADKFNAVRGNQFIADLMPKNPIYTALLPGTAINVMGVPHQSGRAAQRMLEKEGFVYDKYVDIFDGGPTMTAATDQIATIRNTRQAVVRGIADAGAAGVTSIAAAGRLGSFRACYAQLGEVEGDVVIDAGAAEALEISAGEQISYATQ